MVQRRIDSLLCTREDAGAKVKTITAGIQAQATLAQKSIEDGMNGILKLIEDRKQVLLSEVTDMASRKVEVLEKQLGCIEQGTCPAAPPEDPDAEPDPNKFLLCTDEVLAF